MNTDNREEELELNALASIIRRPKRAFGIIRDLGITAEYFASGKRRELFDAIMRADIAEPDKESRGDASAEDAFRSNDLIEKLHPKLLECIGNNYVTTLMDRDITGRNAETNLVEFAKHALRREIGASLWTTVHNPNLPGEMLMDELARIIEDNREHLMLLDNYPNKPKENEEDTIYRTPDELLHVPGFVDALTDYTCSVAPRPNRVLAFAGALAMLSFLTARKYTDRHNTTTNLYIIALADSGVGKDIIRKTNSKLANCDNVKLSGCITDGFSSGEGIEDALFSHPAMLAQIDEFSTVLNSVKESTPISEHYLGALLSLFSTANSVRTLRHKALTPAQKQEVMTNPDAAVKRMKQPYINCPSLTLLATAIPDKFYSSLRRRFLDDGTLARFLILEAGERSKANMHISNEDFPVMVLNMAQQFAQQDHINGWNNVPKFQVAKDEDGVSQIRERITDEADSHYKACAKKHDGTGKSVWNRAVEITDKLALLYALSYNPTNPQITKVGIEWAWKMVVHSIKRMLKMADEYCAFDSDDEKVQEVVRRIREAGSKGIQRSEITNSMHIFADPMNKIEKTLVDRNLIEIIHGAKGAKIYRSKHLKGRN